LLGTGLEPERMALNMKNWRSRILDGERTGRSNRIGGTKKCWYYQHFLVMRTGRSEPVQSVPRTWHYYNHLIRPRIHDKSLE